MFTTVIISVILVTKLGALATDEVHFLRQQINNMQEQMATQMRGMEQKLMTERNERQQLIVKERLGMQQQLATLKQEMQQEKYQLMKNMNTLNDKLISVINSNHKLSEIVSTFDRNVGDNQGFGNTVQSRHNGSLISFSAYATVNRDYSHGVTVLFDAAISNLGSMYSPETSIFLCVYPGYYLFALTVFSDAGDSMRAELMVDGNSVVYVYADVTNLHMASNVVVVQCPEFSQVHVRAVNNENTMWGDLDAAYSTFTGSLLAPL